MEISLDCKRPLSKCRGSRFHFEKLLHNGCIPHCFFGITLLSRTKNNLWFYLRLISSLNKALLINFLRMGMLVVTFFKNYSFIYFY